MTPEQVTDEMCKAFTDVYLWASGIPFEELDRAAVAAAANAMPQSDAQARIDALMAQLSLTREALAEAVATLAIPTTGAQGKSTPIADGRAPKAPEVRG